MKKTIALFTLFLATTLSWAQNEIDIKYEFEKDKADHSLIHVKAKIINKTNKDIYFLSESCNGLDYCLTTNSSLVEVYVMIHCNATFPRKIELKANSNYEFETILKLKGAIEEIGLSLEFVRLSKTTEVEGRFIDEIRKENIKRTSQIEGQIIKIE